MYQAKRTLPNSSSELCFASYIGQVTLILQGTIQRANETILSWFQLMGSLFFWCNHTGKKSPCSNSGVRLCGMLSAHSVLGCQLEEVWTSLIPVDCFRNAVCQADSIGTDFRIKCFFVDFCLDQTREQILQREQF